MNEKTMYMLFFNVERNQGHTSKREYRGNLAFLSGNSTFGWPSAVCVGLADTAYEWFGLTWHAVKFSFENIFQLANTLAEFLWFILVNYQLCGKQVSFFKGLRMLRIFPDIFSNC